MKQAQVLMTMVDGDGSPLMLEPRNVLAHVVKKLDELGLKATVACEFEFYLLDKDMDRKGRPQPPINPATGARETAHEVYGITELDGFMGLLKEIMKPPPNRACRLPAPRRSLPPASTRST